MYWQPASARGRRLSLTPLPLRFFPLLPGATFYLRRLNTLTPLSTRNFSQSDRCCKIGGNPLSSATTISFPNKGRGIADDDSVLIEASFLASKTLQPYNFCSAGSSSFDANSPFLTFLFFSRPPLFRLMRRRVFDFLRFSLLTLEASLFCFPRAEKRSLLIGPGLPLPILCPSTSPAERAAPQFLPFCFP